MVIARITGKAPCPAPPPVRTGYERVLKRLTIPRAGKNVEELELVYAAGGNAK